MEEWGGALMYLGFFSVESQVVESVRPFFYPSPLSLETHKKVQCKPFVIKADKAHLQPAKNNAAVA